MVKKKPKKNQGLKIKFTNVVLLAVIFLLVLVVIFQKLHDTIKTVTQQQVASESAKKVIQKPEVLIPNHSGNQLRVPILMYHYIGNNPNPKDLARNSLSVTPDKFEEQMRYLHDNGYTGISLDTMYAALHKLTILPPKPVVITFDDGYMDFFYNAFPVLLKYNLHATEFIPTGLVNQGYYLTWLQIKQMQASGLVTFGAHTVHHYNLPSLSNESALYELSESKKVLQEQLGVPINFMAFPNGATNNTIIELTKKAGYIGSAGTWPDKTQSEGTTYNMPRLRITGSTDINTFAQLL